MNKLFRGAHFSGLMHGAALLLLVHLVGTLGYRYIGRPSATWIDSFYMTFITVATIGFGETVDLSNHPMGRLFTVFIAVVGIGTMSYLFSSFVALLLESDLNAALRKKRMEKSIAKLAGHYIVCGIGRVGSNMASELVKTQRALVVIENDREALNHWLELHPNTPHLHADAADDESLRRAGVMAAAGVFAVTGDDSHNLMVSLSVKLLNSKARVVARLHDIRNANRRIAPAPMKSSRPTLPAACALPRPWCARMSSISWTRCCAAMTSCGLRKCGCRTVSRTPR